MTSDRTSLRAQASAVERAAMNQRGVENLRSLVVRGKRSLAELDAEVA
jgi:hypothetical protein